MVSVASRMNSLIQLSAVACVAGSETPAPRARAHALRRPNGPAIPPAHTPERAREPARSHARTAARPPAHTHERPREPHPPAHTPEWFPDVNSWRAHTLAVGERDENLGELGKVGGGGLPDLLQEPGEDARRLYMNVLQTCVPKTHARGRLSAARCIRETVWSEGQTLFGSDRKRKMPSRMAGRCTTMFRSGTLSSTEIHETRNCRTNAVSGQKRARANTRAAMDEHERAQLCAGGRRGRTTDRS